MASLLHASTGRSPNHPAHCIMAATTNIFIRFKTFIVTKIRDVCSRQLGTNDFIITEKALENIWLFNWQTCAQLTCFNISIFPFFCSPIWNFLIEMKLVHFDRHKSFKMQFSTAYWKLMHVAYLVYVAYFFPWHKVFACGINIFQIRRKSVDENYRSQKRVIENIFLNEIYFQNVPFRIENWIICSFYQQLLDFDLEHGCYLLPKGYGMSKRAQKAIRIDREMIWDSVKYSWQDGFAALFLCVFRLLENISNNFFG